MEKNRYEIFIVGEFSPFYELAHTEEEAIKTLSAKWWLMYRNDIIVKKITKINI